MSAGNATGDRRWLPLFGAIELFRLQLDSLCGSPG